MYICIIYDLLLKHYNIIHVRFTLILNSGQLFITTSTSKNHQFSGEYHTYHIYVYIYIYIYIYITGHT